MTPVHLAFLLACTLPAGVPADGVPVSSSPTSPAFDALPLVEARVEHERAAPWALRVWPDGRVEERSGLSVSVDASGRASASLGEPSWKTLTTLDAATLDALRAAMRDPALQGLPERVSGVAVEDPAVATWTFRLDGRERLVRVEGAQFQRPPALVAFQKRLDELRAPPRRSTQIWRLREDNQEIERTLRCGPHDVPALSEILRALYASDGFTPGQGVAPSPASLAKSAVVLEIRYIEDGADGGRVLLHEDGRLTETDALSNVEKLMRTLDAASMETVRARIRAAHLASLPDPICGG
jgi:hypothetical protein